MEGGGPDRLCRANFIWYSLAVSQSFKNSIPRSHWLFLVYYNLSRDNFCSFIELASLHSYLKPADSSENRGLVNRPEGRACVESLW